MAVTLGFTVQLPRCDMCPFLFGARLNAIRLVVWADQAEESRFISEKWSLSPYSGFWLPKIWCLSPYFPYFQEYVNTLVGTKGGGNTYPGVCLPFGMIEWTPQTNTGEGKTSWHRGIPYYYDDSTIQGFRGAHYPNGSGMGEYATVTVMPLVGELETDPKVRASQFSHDTEIAKPNYYAVTLADSNIKAEITATTRCGLFMFTFPESENSSILIDVRSTVLIDEKPYGGYVKLIPEKNEIVGYNPQGGRSIVPDNFAGYFAAEFDKAFSSYGTWDEEDIYPDEKEKRGEDRVGAFVKYATQANEIIKVKIGTSFISIEQARKNLQQEIPGWDFAAIREQARDIWNKELGKIEIKGASEEQRIIFYTGLYHCLLLPRVFSEDGRYYSPFDGKVHEGVYYEDFSLWDTFRAEHPLFVLIEPQRDSEMIRCLIQMSEEGGWMPKWPNPGYSNVMIGTHADSVIADAYLKGIQDFDEEKAYKAMRKNAMVSSEDWYEARAGIEYYKELGYLPIDKKTEEGGDCRGGGDGREEQTSRTLEFAYNDFCVAQLAKALGKNEDYELFTKRASNYKNIFDPETKFMRGKNSDGTWQEPFSPSMGRGFTEENAWQYLWFVPHDIQGLIELMGGREDFISKLDTFFESGQYHHGNEPAQHATYLYTYAGASWKTQERVRKVLAELYGPGPDGLCGNEDCGQMSAWYIFSALGFYPVCPGQPVYVLGSPLFAEATIHLRAGSPAPEFTPAKSGRRDDLYGRPYYKGDKFVIKAENVSEENKYIQSVALNGKPLNKPWFEHSAIVNGGELVFVMGPEPNENWGSAPEDAPPSMTKK